MSSDDGGPPTGGRRSVMEGLVKERRFLQEEVASLRAEIEEREKAISVAEGKIRNLTKRLAVEENLAEREAAEKNAKRSRKDGPAVGKEEDASASIPAFPHQCKQRLVVRPRPLKGAPAGGASEKDSDGPPALYFHSYVDAIKTAKNGDRIELHEGYYSEFFSDVRSCFHLCKNVEVRGVGNRDKIVLGAWRHESNPAPWGCVDIGTPAGCECENELIRIYNGADVLFRNVTFDGVDVWCKMVEVVEKSRAWFEQCSFNLTGAEVDVISGASAYFSNCTFRGKSTSTFKGELKSLGCAGSAIRIDPQACSVVVTGCFITGTGVGSVSKDTEYEPEHLPGLAGAIEISERAVVKNRESEEATVHLEVRNTTITGCHGQALTYRRAYGFEGYRGSRRFETSLSELNCVLAENNISNNALGLDGETTQTSLVESQSMSLEEREHRKAGYPVANRRSASLGSSSSSSSSEY